MLPSPCSSYSEAAGVHAHTLDEHTYTLSALFPLTLSIIAPQTLSFTASVP